MKSPASTNRCGALCSVRQAEGSLAGLGVVDTFDLITDEDTEEHYTVVTATTALDLGDAGELELALER